MSFSLYYRVLLRGMLTGAVVLTGTACSRPDRTESGSDNSAVLAVSDTAATPSQSSTSTQPSSPAQPNSPQAETAPADQDAAGYHPMERDTTTVPNQHVDSARVTADAAEASSEMSASIDAEMARDTSSQANAEVSTDTTGNADRIRAPDDSTEILGTVTTTDEAADETADEQIFTPEEPETVAASEAQTDEVGAAAIGGNVTGAEAVALTSRAGVRCAIVDPEATEAVRWDMSSTPITLNPCGMGSMNLSKIWTEGSAGQE